MVKERKPRVQKNGEISAEERKHLSENYPSVKRWLKGKAPGVGYAYSRYMILFNRATGKNPTEFLAWAKTVDPVDVQDLIDQAAETLPSDSIKFNFKIDMRSFLRANGYNNLPKSGLSYTLKDWHRGYRKEEIRKLLGFLDDRLHKLYVYLSVESGLRARTILSITYGHVQEDLEKGIVPVAIRLGPEFYGKKKSAGFTFLGQRSVSLLKDCIKDGLIKPDPKARLIGRSYTNLYKVLQRARAKAALDPKIQMNHGLRKYFESALDHSNIDIDQKRLLEQRLQSWQEEKRHLTERVYQLEEEKKNRNSEITEILQELARQRAKLEELEKKAK